MSQMRWFGTDWGSGMNQECEQMPTPVGTPCLRCTEPILEGENGIVDCGGATLHYECQMRGMIGSVRHQQRRCPCFGFPEEDPSDFNPRQDAVAAVRFFKESVARGRA